MSLDIGLGTPELYLTACLLYRQEAEPTTRRLWVFLGHNVFLSRRVFHYILVLLAPRRSFFCMILVISPGSHSSMYHAASCWFVFDNGTVPFPAVVVHIEVQRKYRTLGRCAGGKSHASLGTSSAIVDTTRNDILTTARTMGRGKWSVRGK